MRASELAGVLLVFAVIIFYLWSRLIFLAIVSRARPHRFCYAQVFYYIHVLRLRNPGICGRLHYRTPMGLR